MTEPTAPIETNPPTQSPEANYSKPRITIQYCTQCKWMLRAAYFAQELLSTFNTDIGEIALIPRTGGIFTVTIFPSISASTSTTSDSQSNYESESHFSKVGTILWDRKRDGGFPEVKELKSRVRNVIDPGRDLGHTDRALKKGAIASHSTPATATTGTSTDATATPASLSARAKIVDETAGGAERKSDKEVCEDCLQLGA
ncbi:Rdx family-domain-containing protein [Aspergillus tetrazonus]